jgi:hypothetical protein
MSKPETARKLYTQKELALVLGLCTETISRLTSQKVIPCFRVGRILRYDLNGVLAAMSKPAEKKPK